MMLKKDKRYGKTLKRINNYKPSPKIKEIVGDLKGREAALKIVEYIQKTPKYGYYKDTPIGIINIGENEIRRLKQ